jgi:HEPN domain-containing protein
MVASPIRTRACDSHQAKQRMERAREFLTVAEFVVDEKDEDASFVYASSAAALAVLAGIAASDAACCGVLQERSRSQNHRDAERLLAQITQGGKGAADDLRELLNLKDKAQYGFLKMSVPEVRKVMRRASRLVEFAAEVLSA